MKKVTKIYLVENCYEDPNKVTDAGSSVGAANELDFANKVASGEYTVYTDRGTKSVSLDPSKVPEGTTTGAFGVAFKSPQGKAGTQEGSSWDMVFGAGDKKYGGYIPEIPPTEMTMGQAYAAGGDMINSNKGKLPGNPKDANGNPLGSSFSI